MIKAGLSISLVVCLTLPALAAKDPAKDKTPKPTAVAVSDLLERAAKSPLGPGDARLLRAVADLIDKEQVPSAHQPTISRYEPAMAPKAVPVPVQAAQPMPAPKVAPVEQPRRLVIRLSHVPAISVAKTLEEFLDSQQKFREPDEEALIPGRAVFVPEPISNSLLISATPEIVDELTELVAQLDAKPDLVMVEMCIAELLLPSGDGKTNDPVSGDSAKEKMPQMKEDGAAWLAWAKKHDRLEILSQPQIMTLDNQLATIRIGETVPTVALRPGTDGPDKGNRIEQTEVGLTIELTPRISPEGAVLMELHVEHASIVNGSGTTGPILGKTTLQTAIWAKDGQTVVLGGLKRRVEDGHRQLIVAVTPRVNPKR